MAISTIPGVFHRNDNRGTEGGSTRAWSVVSIFVTEASSIAYGSARTSYSFVVLGVESESSHEIPESEVGLADRYC